MLGLRWGDRHRQGVHLLQGAVAALGLQRGAQLARQLVGRRLLLLLAAARATVVAGRCASRGPPP
eukprot:7289710-Pyramimonas_sp.AAC.1